MNLFKEHRKLLLSEKGTVYKDPGGRINISLIYPNTYHIGMSNLGFTGLYTLFNTLDDVVCERAFLPEKDDIDWMERTRSQLISFESGRLLNRFDVIAFSVSFENDYTNVLKILSLARIKHFSTDRNDRDPLIIMGGPCAFLNPEPLADFMDAIFIGEVEEAIDNFVGVLRDKKAKKEKMISLSALEGWYIPSLYEPVYSAEGQIIKVKKKYRRAPDLVKRVYVNDLNKTVLTSRLSTPNTEFKNMYLIEAMRGCPFSCRFCAAGHAYNPPRQRSEDVLEKECNLARERGLKVGIIAPSLSEYSGITGILNNKDVHFSITSLRASKRSADIVKMLKDKRSVSIAPEAGSQRLRNIINKKISEEDILETSKSIFESTIKNLKLYFMVGIPNETEEDIEAIIELAKKIRSLSKKGTLFLTLSIFVPKPFTPFQWYPMTDEKVVRERIQTVKKALSKEGIKVQHDAVRDAYVQGLLAMGDRRVSKALMRMISEYNWKKACDEAGINYGFYVFQNKKFAEILPWDFIDHGISKEKLWEEYQKALKV